MSAARRSPRLALASAGILLLMGIAVALYEDRFAADQHRREIGVEAAILARSVAAAVQFNDRGAAEEYLNALRANPEILSATAYDARGTPIGAIVQANGSVPTSYSRTLHSGQPGQIRLLVPITQSGDRIGTVYLSAAPESPDTRVARLAGVILLAAMAALVLAVLAQDRAALAGVNFELEKRATDLVIANQRLKAEMEFRRNAEGTLHQMQKMEAIGQLSGGIAHDLNNYLAVIRGSLNLVKRGGSDGGQDVRPYIASALEGVDRAAGLTRRLLAFARRQPLLPQTVAPQELIEGMMDLIKRTIGERVVVETRLESTWPISCDPNQLETVILNLAINARDAMPDGGKLVIATRDKTLQRHIGVTPFEFVPGDYVEITVRDNGIGMSEEIRNRALEPFFTTKPKGRGTGLGLSTAFGYVRQSGGYLSIESSRGKGTAVVILIPRCIAQNQPRVHSAARDAA